MDHGGEADRTQQALGHLAAAGVPDLSWLTALAGRWWRGELAGRAPSGREVSINFHPDRWARGGRTVLEAIAETGQVASTFSTGTTNGFPLTARDGLRQRREDELFGPAYQHAAAAQRPVYGGLNLFALPRGAWPRFGSCHWVLHPGVLRRCSVTVPGSQAARCWTGSPEELACLLADVPPPADGRPDGHRFRRIDGLVEVQVHGGVQLGRDVVALVLDRSFGGTAVQAVAEEVGERFGVALSWAPELTVAASDLRVPATRVLAAAAVDRAARVGAAVSARWIGEQWPAGASCGPADGARRYLWNRLLLVQPDPAPLAAQASVGERPSSEASGRAR